MHMVTDRTNTERPAVMLSGRFDAFETEEFRAMIDGLLDATNDSVSVDMSDVVFVDSTGLSELVRTMKVCRKRGGDLFIESPSDPVRVILELTGLSSSFSINEG